MAERSNKLPSKLPDCGSQDPSPVEESLVLYLTSVLKHQIAPMLIEDLRGLVDFAPKDLNIVSFVKENYNGDGFVQLLKKYPSIFQVNEDNTVLLKAATYCIVAEKDKSCDEVDRPDMAEYISDPDSD